MRTDKLSFKVNLTARVTFCWMFDFYATSSWSKYPTSFLLRQRFFWVHMQYWHIVVIKIILKLWRHLVSCIEEEGLIIWQGMCQESIWKEKISDPFIWSANMFFYSLFIYANYAGNKSRSCGILWPIWKSSWVWQWEGYNKCYALFVIYSRRLFTESGSCRRLIKSPSDLG